MQDLIILGTGVHSAEMAHIVERINRVTPTWRLIGHVAPKPTSDTTFAGDPILGTIEAIARYPEAKLVPDNEFPRDIPLPNARMISIVDPSAYVHPSARIGGACVIYPGCFIGFNAVLGQRVFVLSGSTINHDDHLEDGVSLASGVTLAGFVRVEEGAYIGQAATVRQFLRIGRHSLIGMGSVVIKNVEPRSVMVGNPARKLRDKA
jgi:sugar O-acyltransferase (sialic acid O-acetyltransferase NeuD family)